MDALKPALNGPFKVEFEGISDGSSPEYFYAVDGLGISYRTEKYLPGGYSQPFEIPVAYQADQLVLRRPLHEEKTKITQWCEEALDSGTFKPVAAQIFVLNRNGGIVTHWSIENVYPTGVKISSLSYTQGSRVIEETITLVYAAIKRVA